MLKSPSGIVAEFVDDIPVDLDEMAKRLDVLVEYDEGLPRAISGKIGRSRRSPSGFKITVNANDSHGRQRFTLAHEIAHYILHRDLIDEVVDNEMYRSSLSSDLERQANRYAAKILLPAEAVRRLYRRAPDAFSLARKFDVSLRAMEIRLSELGLPT